MDSLSHDPAAGDIGSQLVEIGSRGLAAGNAATMPTMTGLVPAGGEEVSAQGCDGVRDGGRFNDRFEHGSSRGADASGDSVDGHRSDVWGYR